MTKSISCGVVPARSMAILLASTPMVVVVSPVRSAYLLSLMPVLSCIHSSLVSIYFNRSLFVTTVFGTYIPIPAIFVCRIAIQLEKKGSKSVPKGRTGCKDYDTGYGFTNPQHGHLFWKSLYILMSITVLFIRLCSAIKHIIWLSMEASIVEVSKFGLC